MKYNNAECCVCGFLVSMVQIEQTRLRSKCKYGDEYYYYCPKCKKYVLFQASMIGAEDEKSKL